MSSSTAAITHGEDQGVEASAESAEAALAATRRRRKLTLWFLAFAMLFISMLGLMIGAVPVPFMTVLKIIGTKLGLMDADLAVRDVAVVWSIRMPRVFLGLGVGAGLGLAGAALQGLFRNPLADPGLIGVSSGAALGAVGTIVLFGSNALPLLGWAGPLQIPIAAAAGGLLATWLVYVLATREGVTDTATLLLAGIAINAIGGALLGLLIFIADDAQLRSSTLWLMGSLGAAKWSHLPLVLIPILAAGYLLSRDAVTLNALALGEREAGQVGVDVKRVRKRVVVLSAILVGAATAFSGVIGFVGLVVPHLMRLASGPDHRVVLPGAALLGAALLVLADLGARTLGAPAELPIGVLTSLVGGPFFLSLLLRRRRM